MFCDYSIIVLNGRKLGAVGRGRLVQRVAGVAAGTPGLDRAQTLIRRRTANRDVQVIDAVLLWSWHRPPLSFPNIYKHFLF
jgi:hypothetical protein